ncbi:MAG: SGNH/GDSL hydrolase family protein, partial [Kiritimatiellae bacterium]|nr:SGNH/GDSL hydrolase family protein [Kiritimatiellia bacterium]
LALPSYASVMGTVLPTKIRAHGIGVLAGATRWLRFNSPSRVSYKWSGMAAPVVPTASEVQLPGAATTDCDVELRVNGSWPIGTTVKVDYVLRNLSGQVVSVRGVRLLGQVIAAIGDSMTYGVRRRRDGTMETPNWAKPWLSYPSQSSWNNYYGNWNDINFQGSRGFLRRDLTTSVPWAGHYANGHGPDHCGYSGSRTSHIISTLDDTSRTYPRNAFMANPSYTVVIYWIGLNDTSGGSPGEIFDRWKQGLNRILALRSGRGRTLVVGVTLPRIRSDYAGYSPERQANQDVVNSYIRGYTMSTAYARYVVANIESVPHDSNDDGLHFMATGYERVEQIVRQAILNGMKAGP